MAASEACTVLVILCISLRDLWRFWYPFLLYKLVIYASLLSSAGIYVSGASWTFVILSLLKESSPAALSVIWRVFALACTA